MSATEIILSAEEVVLIRKYPKWLEPIVDEICCGGPDGSYFCCYVCGNEWGHNFFSNREIPDQPHKEGCEHEKLEAIRAKLLGHA